MMLPKEKATEKWVNDILSKYRQRVGDISLPIDERTLIKIIEEKEGIDIELKEKKKVYVGRDEGSLMPKRGGFILQYGYMPYKKERKLFNPNARKRFTICHELAHIFFYDCNSVIPKKIQNPPEHKCSSIARKLLLPKELLMREFAEEYESDVAAIPFLRNLARKARVSLYPLAKRLTEDLSLLENVMITFWEYQGKNTVNDIRYSDFWKDSKTCPRLRKLLPKYWRDYIHMKVWNEVIRRVAIAGMDTHSKKTMLITSKRKKKGKKKIISFEVECETLVGQSLLKWTRQVHNALSVEKFDLNLLN